LRARPGATSAEFIQVFGYGGAASLALSDLAARRPQTAQDVRDLERFRAKPAPGLPRTGFRFAQGRASKTKFSARHDVTSAEFIQVFVEPRRDAPGLNA
jgi:hypothetical protein